jgi:hypothetical protein
MVIFRNDGKPGYHQVDDLDGALRFVEHLRNNEGVEMAQVYRLEEIPIEVRTVFKVELARNGSSTTPEPSGADPAEAADDGSTKESLDAGARRSIFR